MMDHRPITTLQSVRSQQVSLSWDCCFIACSFLCLFFFLRNDSERLEKALAITVLQMSVDPLEQEFYKLVFSGTFNKIIQNRQNQAASWERTASELRKLTGPCLPQWQLSHCLLPSCRYLLWWGFFQFCILTVLLFRIFIRLL